MNNTPQRILIAGASGYIGKALVTKLLELFPQAQIIALSRSAQESTTPRVRWVPCDLFSLSALSAAIPADIDLAYYLVHSMGPTAHLDQGNFADYDLILADNFAKVLKQRPLQRLIYLGGLTPETTNDKLSLHLQSRIEVEDCFRGHGLPTTIFRAGLILGDGGSSFQILLKLVKRLPVMICPQWTQNLTTPVDIGTTIDALTHNPLDSPAPVKIYDLAGCAPLTYVDMMAQTAEQLGMKKFFYPVPYFSVTLSRLWVSLITNSSKDLVYPLVASLKHEMVARKDHLHPVSTPNRSFRQMLQEVSLRTYPGRALALFSFRPGRRTVRSVQRLPLPPGRDARWAAHEYVNWLPRYMRPLLKVTTSNNVVQLSLLIQRFMLLELSTNDQPGATDHHSLSIQKGALVAQPSSGRLEFRAVLSRRFLLVAIHDFKPALPWFIYRYTQAVAHLWVMKAFSRHLTRSQAF